MSELPSMLFFLALFDMQLSGWEVFALSLGIPIILCINFFKKLTASKVWIFRLLSLIGFLAFYVDEVTHKAAILGIGMIL
jgi:hypothetical protein